MKIDKITPQIAALYIGQACDVIHGYCMQGSAVEDPLHHNIEIDIGIIEKLAAYSVIIIPHLRRLESITEGEAREVFKAYNSGRDWPLTDESCLNVFWNDSLGFYGVGAPKKFIGLPSVWLYLLSRGFDLFGLIDLGLAKEIQPE